LVRLFLTQLVINDCSVSHLAQCLLLLYLEKKKPTKCSILSKTVLLFHQSHTKNTFCLHFHCFG